MQPMPKRKVSPSNGATRAKEPEVIELKEEDANLLASNTPSLNTRPSQVKLQKQKLNDGNMHELVLRAYARAMADITIA